MKMNPLPSNERHKEKLELNQTMGHHAADQNLTMEWATMPSRLVDSILHTQCSCPVSFVINQMSRTIIS